MIGFPIRTDKPTDMERSIDSCNRRSVEAESSLTYMAGAICAARRIRRLLKDLPTADVLYSSALIHRTRVHIDSGSDCDSLHRSYPVIDTEDLRNENARPSVVVRSRIFNMIVFENHVLSEWTCLSRARRFDFDRLLPRPQSTQSRWRRSLLRELINEFPDTQARSSVLLRPESTTLRDRRDSL